MDNERLDILEGGIKTLTGEIRALREERRTDAEKIDTLVGRFGRFSDWAKDLNGKIKDILSKTENIVVRISERRKKNVQSALPLPPGKIPVRLANERFPSLTAGKCCTCGEEWEPGGLCYKVGRYGFACLNPA